VQDNPFGFGPVRTIIVVRARRPAHGREFMFGRDLDVVFLFYLSR
jgi:hypothetical protein